MNDTSNNTNITYTGPKVTRLDMTFTHEGLQTLKVYRARLSKQAGRTVSMGQALDALIKTHSLMLRGDECVR